MVKMEFVLLVVAISCLEAAKLPTYIMPCSASDPNLNECARKHGQEALPSLIKGDSKYKIPNMTPLRLTKVQFTSGNLNVNLQNITVRGLEDTRIKDIRIDLPKKHISITILVDAANLVSDYDIKGNILILPITGNGKVNITFVGGEYLYEIDYSLKDNQGKEYLNILKDQLTYKIKRSYYYFENLFGGDAALGEQTNQLLNERWQDVEHELGPAVTDVIRSLVKATVEGVIHKVPFNQLLLP